MKDIVSPRIDPEIHGLIPPLSDAEREQLEENIERDGRILSPGIVWNGILLDGHNRQEIAAKLGIPFPTVAVDLPDRVAALMWVVNHQEGRRNLTEFARAEMALKLRTALAADAAERMKAGKPAGKEMVEKANENGNSDPSTPRGTRVTAGRSMDQAAAKAGVGKNTVQRVEKVKADGDPKLVEMARKGDVSVSAAAAVATLPKREQKKVVADGPEAVKEVARQIRKGEVTVTESPAGEPWAAFVADIEAVISDLRSASRRLSAALGYDSETKRLTVKWAHFLSHAGTAGAINTVIRTLQDQMPAEASDKPPGFIPRRSVEARERVKKG